PRPPLLPYTTLFRSSAASPTASSRDSSRAPRDRQHRSNLWRPPPPPPRPPPPPQKESADVRRPLAPAARTVVAARDHPRGPRLRRPVRAVLPRLPVGRSAHRTGRGRSRMSIRVLVVDNHDSFVHARISYLRELGAQVTMVEADVLTDPALLDTQLDVHDAVMISPGPGAPADAGASLAVVHAAADR